MKRNIMENILLGNGAWYYDHHLKIWDIYTKEEYWNTKERLDTIKEMQDVCKKLLEKPYKKTTDVLLVVDAENKYYSARWTAWSKSYEFIDAIGKSGVGFDRLFLSDLKKCDIERYKCVVFLDCFSVSQSKYDYLKNKIMKNGRTVVFVNGFAEVIETPTGSVINDKYSIQKEYFEEETNDYRLISMPQMILDPSYYHNVFKKSGAHIYTEANEVCIADNEMVMMHCREKDETVLHLHCGDIKLKNKKFTTVIYNSFTGEKIL